MNLDQECSLEMSGQIFGIDMPLNGFRSSSAPVCLSKDSLPVVNPSRLDFFHASSPCSSSTRGTLLLLEVLRTPSTLCAFERLNEFPRI